MSFRNEIFQLCKIIQKDENTKAISEFMRSLSTVQEGEEFQSSRSAFHQVAKHSKNQFYGYLYANEHTEEYRTIFPQITPLSAAEIQLVARAHATIATLVKGCLAEVERDFPKISRAMDPYAKYKPISQKEESSWIRTDNYERAIRAFQSSTLYQKLYTSNVNACFEALNTEDIHMMFAVLEQEMKACPLDKMPESIEGLIKCLHTGFTEVSEVLMAEVILILGLRKSLENACSLLFTALVGEDLIVLNNDNIISVEKSSSNFLYKIMQLSCNEIFINASTNTAGDIALVDCAPHVDYHIHEFGMIDSYTANWDQEMGETSKITLVMIDELLNPISALTNQIIVKNLPPVIKQDT